MEQPNIAILIDSLNSEQKDVLYFKIEDFIAETKLSERSKAEAEKILIYIEKS